MAITIPSAIEDIWELRLVGSLHGQTTINTWHYATVAAEVANLSAANLQSVAETFNDGVLDVLAALTSEEQSYDLIQLQKIAPTRYIVYQAVPGATAGQVVGNSLPSAVSVVTKRQTIFAGTAGRGRCYFSGIPQGSEQDSELNAAAAAQWQTFASGVFVGSISVPGVITLAPIIWGKEFQTNNGLVVVGSADSVLRYQRRREVGRGI